jgi:hypothetical protein
MKFRTIVIFLAINFSYLSTLLAAPQSLSDNGNGTVKDHVTGLLWQKCSGGANNDYTCSGNKTSYLWKEALQYCRDLQLDNKVWRLPSISELKTIINYTRIYPAIDTAYFPNASYYYWSSSTHIKYPEYVWQVNFNTGTINAYSKTDKDYVRCVSEAQ